MWDALIPAIFSVLKNHFDEIAMRICSWVVSFVLCWLFMPIGLQLHLINHALPGLPDYTLLYLFLFAAATAFWLMFLIALEVLILLIEICLKRKAVKPQSKWVEIDGEYKNYTFFKCHRLSLLLRIKKSSSSVKN